MVVFICEACGATLKKQQVDRHCGQCKKGAWNFTCVECMLTFEGFDYQKHTQCMTEVQKFQGKFIQKQRDEKERAKQDQKLTRLDKPVKEEKVE